MLAATTARCRHRGRQRDHLGDECHGRANLDTWQVVPGLRGRITSTTARVFAQPRSVCLTAGAQSLCIQGGLRARFDRGTVV